MTCRRICRELLWLTRFGELGPSSAPHLSHLAQCRGCRDEVGFDRALVRQLRIALAQRIESEEPSAGAWSAILARAQAPDRGIVAYLRTRAASMAIRLRTATAITAVALAGILATGTDVGVTHPEAGSAETELLSVEGERFERQALGPRPVTPVSVPVAYVVAPPVRDPEALFLVSASMPAQTQIAAVDPEPQAEPETRIQAVVSIGTAGSRLRPADLEGRLPTAPAPPVTEPVEDHSAGEPS